METHSRNVNKITVAFISHPLLLYYSVALITSALEEKNTPSINWHFSLCAQTVKTLTPNQSLGLLTTS